MDPIRTILVAVDFSEHSDAAADAAATLAKQLGAEVHVVHAFDLRIPMLTPYEVAIPEPYIEESREAAVAKLSAVATTLMENTTVRIQLLAYAKASSDGASRARRLSLSRALAVRAYLIEKGVRSTRMDVRALGDKLGDGPADRVDILPQAAN